MSSIPLFDLLLARERRPAGLAVSAQDVADWAGRLVDELLSEFAHIETIDERVGAARGEDGPFDRDMALALQAAYEQWAYRADAVLKRIGRLERQRNRVVGSDALRRSYGRTMAMLSVSLDDLDAAQAEMERGEFISGENLRRELRLPSKQ